MHACINVIWYQNQVPRGNQCYIYFVCFSDIKPTFTFRKTSSVIATLQAYTQLPFKEAILFTHLFYKRALKLFSSFIYHVQHYFTMIQLIKHGCKNSIGIPVDSDHMTDKAQQILSPFYKNIWLTFTTSIDKSYKVWWEITYPFPNINGATAEVCECIRNLIALCAGYVITIPSRDDLN